MIEENKENETTNENEDVVRKTISIKGVSADVLIHDTTMDSSMEPMVNEYGHTKNSL